MTAEEAFNHHLADAKAIPTHEVLDFFADTALVYNNVKRGVANVVALEGAFLNDAAIRALPDTTPEALRETLSVAQAFEFAAGRVNRDVGSDGTIQKLHAIASPLRKALLQTAEALVLAGLLPDAEIAPIRPGHGMRDTANDCVALASVFNRHKAAIAGKHAITEEQVRQAAEVGSKLQTLVRDNKAVRERKTPQAVLDQVEIRNRFWTLLNARHDKLWRVGAWLAGRDRADEMVPPLQSRQAAPRAQAVAAAGGESTEPPSVPSPKK